MGKKTILFSPGPVMTSDRVRGALSHYDICHRSPEFEQLYADTTSKINRLFGADDSYKSVIISGSGTSANECVISSIYNKGESAMLLRNGEFGDRLKQILDQYEIPYIDVEFKWADAIDLEKVKEALENHPEVKCIHVVFHETSTSMINDIEGVRALAHQYDKLLHVDCVSAAGGQKINVNRMNITFATSVGGKAVGAYPGTAYVCAKEEILKTLSPEMGRNVYLNLARHYRKAAEKNQTPNTPNVPLFFALNEALTIILNEEGLDNRISRYKEDAHILREGLKAMGLKFLLPESQMSNTVTSVFLPTDKKADDFIAALECEGYTVYAGKGELYGMNMIQVANMGEIYPDDCREFLKVFRRVLEA